MVNVVMHSVVMVNVVMHSVVMGNVVMLIVAAPQFIAFSQVKVLSKYIRILIYDLTDKGCITYKIIIKYKIKYLSTGTTLNRK
jgi:hypothetical protein